MQRKQESVGMVENQTETNAVGRPPKPEHLKRKNRVVILLNDAELKSLDEHIVEAGFADRNDFGRKLILDEIGRAKRGQLKETSDE